MPTDPVIASVHFRVESAGMSVERAVSFLNQREVIRGRMAVQAALYDLVAAERALKASGQYADRLAYVQQLVQFYTAQMNQILRPAAAPGVAKSLADNQANLLSASPV